MKHLWIFIHIFLFPLTVLSHDLPIEIRAKKFNLSPGTTTTIPIVIVNHENKTADYEITVDKPSSKIEILSLNKKISIGAFEKEVILLPINISKECSSGIHHIYLKITDKKTLKEHIFTIELIISDNNDISLTSLKNMEYIKSGDTIFSEFTVKNLGNIDQKIHLYSAQGSIKGKDQFVLKPQEEKQITVSKATSKKETQSYLQIVDLNILQSIDNIEKKLSAFHSVNIIPVNPHKLDAYRRIPLLASLTYLNMRQSNETKQGWQGELYTKSSLSENGNDLLEVRILTKNPIEYNTFAQYEEYYLRYSTAKTYIHIGDKLFSSSFLTEYARYGRGVEVQYDFGKVAIGGFYNKPRFYKTITDEFNINTKFVINEKNNILAGYLQKRLFDKSFNSNRDK